MNKEEIVKILEKENDVLERIIKICQEISKLIEDFLEKQGGENENTTTT